MDDKAPQPSNPMAPQAPSMGPKPASPSQGGPAVPSGGTDLKFVNPTTPASAPSMPSQGQPMQPAPRPAPSPVPMPQAPQSSMPPRPMAPAPAPQAPSEPAKAQEYRTSIRTMSDDISKIKTGQQPTGVDIKKTISASPAPTSVPAAKPVMPPAPMGPSTQTSLGAVEKARPLAPLPKQATPPPAAPSAPAQIFTPAPNATGGSSHNKLYILIAIAALLVGALYWLLVANKQKTIVETTPTPTQIATSTPTPVPQKTLSTIFTMGPETIVIASAGNPSTNFLKKLNALSLTAGQAKKLSILTDTKGVMELSPMGLLDRLLITYPTELKSTLGTESIILVYGQKESYDAKGVIIPASPTAPRLALITEVSNGASAQVALTTWEATMTNVLSSLFGFSKAKAATPGFVSTTYQQNNIRYKNFPTADRSIDYSIVRSSSGKSYLVITNSREAIYSIIDQLK